uniref:Uncharacterized protein n=1 Tax=Pseudomonas putida TaxID=303 RepID=A0A7M1HWT2_PSEPU|nr:hypothetical protein [Pseudomonas putida]QOQ30738.1 Hypothetical protein [Pseudomonas putida]WJN66781.1 hypothetical protein [Pseudomonas putida]
MGSRFLQLNITTTIRPTNQGLVDASLSAGNLSFSEDDRTI